MARKSSREAILDAAERVIGSQGLSHATLEAVAAAAGISKGGLLYHFSSKKDLLRNLIQRHTERTITRKDDMMKTLPESPGREFKAYILARIGDPSRLNMSASKMVGIVEDEDLRSLVTEIKRKEIQSLDENSAFPELATILLLAMEGLWLLDILNVPAFTPEIRERLLDTIMDLAELSCRGPGGKEGIAIITEEAAKAAQPVSK